MHLIFSKLILFQFIAAEDNDLNRIVMERVKERVVKAKKRRLYVQSDDDRSNKSNKIHFTSADQSNESSRIRSNSTRAPIMRSTKGAKAKSTKAPSNSKGKTKSKRKVGGGEGKGKKKSNKFKKAKSQKGNKNKKHGNVAPSTAQRGASSNASALRGGSPDADPFHVHQREGYQATVKKSGTKRNKSSHKKKK